MIAYRIRRLGTFHMAGHVVEVRERLTGWPDGLKFWVRDWRIVRERVRLRWLLGKTERGPWHRASEYELELLGFMETKPR